MRFILHCNYFVSVFVVRKFKVLFPFWESVKADVDTAVTVK